MDYYTHLMQAQAHGYHTYRRDMELLEKIDEYINEISVNNLMDHIPPKWFSKTIMKTGVRKKINTQIQKFLKPTYFKSIPLDELFDILEKNGIKPIQEDNTEWSGWLLGGVKKTEQVHFNLAWKDEYERDQGMKRYKAIKNAVLNMSYYKMQSGNFEVISYVS